MADTIFDANLQAAQEGADRTVTLHQQIERCFREGDTELGEGYAYRMIEWMNAYLDEYDIAQEDVDILKITYAFGLVFADYLQHLGKGRSYKHSLL